MRALSKTIFTKFHRLTSMWNSVVCAKICAICSDITQVGTIKSEDVKESLFCLNRKINARSKIFLNVYRTYIPTYPDYQKKL